MDGSHFKASERMHPTERPAQCPAEPQTPAPNLLWSARPLFCASSQPATYSTITILLVRPALIFLLALRLSHLWGALQEVLPGVRGSMLEQVVCSPAVLSGL